MEKSNGKKMTWVSVALMSFTSVWGFANVINGFSAYDGMQSMSAWILVFLLYFLPYALMVGELASTFKNADGGVTSWIYETIGPRAAYYAGWTFWVVHMPYLSQKPNSALISASWAIFQDNRMSSMNTAIFQLCCLAVFVIALLLATKGLSMLKIIASISGMAMFVMSILFILMVVAAPAIVGAPTTHVNWSWDAIKPVFDLKFFTSLSILIFAVGGCEKLSPYVNKTKNPSRDFSRGMIALAIMVAACALLGTVALGMMFSGDSIPDDLMTNGAFYAFQMVGDYYGIGNSLMILYAIVNFVGQMAALIISIDAPLRMLLNAGNEKFIPKSLFKQNKRGVYVNGYILIFIIVSILIIIPALGIGSVNDLVTWLIKLNASCMPLRYLWVFLAYILLKKSYDKYQSEYHFVKNKKIGMIIGIWCFLVTALACIGGLYSQDPFQLILNILTSFVLLALGLIMPAIAKKHREKR